MMGKAAFTLILLLRRISLAFDANKVYGDGAPQEDAAQEPSGEVLESPAESGDGNELEWMSQAEQDSEDDESEAADTLHSEEMKGDKIFSQEEMMKLHSAWDSDNDGKVSMAEVLSFASTVHKSAALKNGEHSLRIFDTSKDGRLSMEEVLAGLQWDDVSEEELRSMDDSAEKDKLLKEREARKQFEIEKFKAADVDGDGTLTKDEVSHYFHPETHNESLKVMAMDTLKRRDKDGNGKLSEREFLQNLDDDEPEPDFANEHEQAHKEEFKRLDKDGDGHLDIHELMPWESGMSHVERVMGKLFEDADADKDGHVSAKELDEIRSKIAGSDAHHYLADWTAHADL